MAFDGIFLRAVVAQLQFLTSGKVAKIAQPFADEVVLTIRKDRTNHHLLLTANPKTARVSLIAERLGNQLVAPNFLMVLRKYLEKATLTNIEQLGCDRVVNFQFAKRDELGDQKTLTLSLEIMGRHSNLILIDDASQTIIEAIRHVSIAQNRYRTLLPQAHYRKPPQQDKVVLPTTADDDLVNLVHANNTVATLSSALMQHYQGFSRVSATLLAQAILLDGVKSALTWFTSAWHTPQPTQFYWKPRADKGEKAEFSAVVPPAAPATGAWVKFNEVEPSADIFTLINTHYAQLAHQERIKSSGKKLITAAKHALKHNETKLARLKKDLAKSDNADHFRVCGEVLTTYLYQVKQGMTSIELPNYYTEDQKPLKISLNPTKSPAQNAQSYFKRYTKLKNSIAILTKQIKLTQAEVDYLTGILAQINVAEPEDLTDIAQELQHGGYLPAPTNAHGKRKKVQRRHAQIARYTAPDGTKISVGKSNIQNERLTLKIAAKSDYWLHVKDVPGAHVIVHSDHPSDETLTFAAELAAYYSKYRAAANVAVDCVPVKRIKKPKGTKPGFVIYTHQKTLTVTPNEQRLAHLKHE